MSLSDNHGYAYTFPAIRGTQSDRLFYVAMCPLHVIPKIMMFDEEQVPPALRAQRTLNKNRVPAIADYLVENPTNYILSALTASINSEVSFIETETDGMSSNMGMLSIPMTAHILINDGQHRRAAIETALTREPALGQDNVPVLFFIDVELERSQQMFADLNRYAVRPSPSLSTLYDLRDSSSDLARYLAFSCIPFKGFTEFEKSSISQTSAKLFTLSSIKYATRALLGKSPKDAHSDEEQNLAVGYWEALSSNMTDWLLVREKKMPAGELRENFVHGHGIVLQALGILGYTLLSQHSKDWSKRLSKLKSIDWSRDNPEWEGRAMNAGRISKSRNNIVLTCNFLKKTLGVELTEKESVIEKQYLDR